MKEKLSTKIINEIRRPLEALCVKLAIKMNPLMKQRERKIPMKYGFKNLAPLCRSIGLQNKSIEQFEITYNNPRLFTVMPCEVTKSHIITVF